MEDLVTACFLFYYFAAAVMEIAVAETMVDADATLSGCCSSSPAADAVVDLVSAEAETAAAVVNVS